MTKKNFSPKAQEAVDSVESQLEGFSDQVKSMTLDKMNEAPVKEKEEPKISQKEIEQRNEIYLKPTRSVSCREPFNEKYRKDFEFGTEYVCFTAENNEIIGENIEIWTKPFAGMPAQFWTVPVRIPVWGPRHLAEQLTRCRYHRMTMELDEKKIVGADSRAKYYGQMTVDSTIQRMDAKPAKQQKSVFMGATSF